MQELYGYNPLTTYEPGDSVVDWIGIMGAKVGTIWTMGADGVFVPNGNWGEKWATGLEPATSTLATSRSTN